MPQKEIRTVSYRSYSACNEPVPSVIIQGLYLKGCGFEVGARFKAHLDWGRIVLTLMDKTKLNQYQSHNLERKEATRPDVFGYSYQRSCGYQCVDCGQEVSPGTLLLYHCDVLVLKCKKCRYTNQIAYEQPI